MRRAAKKDDAQKAIERDSLACGVLALDTSKLGDGFPDLVGYHAASDVWRVAEVKTGVPTRKYGAKKSAGYKLNERTDAQVKLLAKAPIPLVHNLAEWLALFGLEVT